MLIKDHEQNSFDLETFNTTFCHDEMINSVPIKKALLCSDDMSSLDKHLNCLNGQISLIKTKYTPEGKKVRIIKIKRIKNSKTTKQNDLKMLINKFRN